MCAKRRYRSHNEIECDTIDYFDNGESRFDLAPVLALPLSPNEIALGRLIYGNYIIEILRNRVASSTHLEWGGR